MHLAMTWALAGRAEPRLAPSLRFALGSHEEARAQVHRHLRCYLNRRPAEYVDVMVPTTGFAGSDDELATLIRGFAAVGTDEIQFIPTSSDVGQLRRIAEMGRAIDV